MAYTSGGLRCSLPGRIASDTGLFLGAFAVLWYPVRNELYHQQGRQMVAVDYMTEPESRVGTPQVLFERKFADVNGATYDLHPDGSRFLMLEPIEQARPDHLELVVNWSSEVERLVPREGL